MGGQSFIDWLADFFVPVHREGHALVGLAALATLGLFFLWSPAGWLGALITFLIAYAFRDPDRVVPLREGLVLAPADGRVAAIERHTPPAEAGLGSVERTRLSIALSPLDVPIARAPLAGSLGRALYVPGRFSSPLSDRAGEENERRISVIRTPAGTELGLVQIAGPASRRVVAFCEEGQSLGAGERIGLGPFGSRVDLYLPPGREVLVAIGQRLIAGETVVADLASDEPERLARKV
ncbi:MAG: phosphatidylserine decarboxylase [Hyphomicrobiaceae bacterium]